MNAHRKLVPPDASVLGHSIRAQLNALIPSMGIPDAPARRLLDSLVGQSLQGPFHNGGRRFSAINADGVPFQWSVSEGSRRGGLRFIADCGIPGASIAERVRSTRATLEDIAEWLPLSTDTLCALDVALECLLPPASLLEDSLMGLCVAVGITPVGTRLKVYVNGEVGTPRERYERFARCLSALDRPGALGQLRDVASAAGDRVVPAFVAVDLDAAGIGRLKLYFRPADGDPALHEWVAEAAGCTNAGALLEAFHRTFLTGPAYPAHAVDLSVEFPPGAGEPGFKVDLRTVDFIDSDAEVDTRIRRLTRSLGAPDSDYCVMRDIVVGLPSRDRVEQILFVGLASREKEYQVDVYFHPGH